MLRGRLGNLFSAKGKSVVAGVSAGAGRVPLLLVTPYPVDTGDCTLSSAHLAADHSALMSACDMVLGVLRL